MIDPKICIWDDLTFPNANSILHCKDEQYLKRLLQSIIGTTTENSRQEKILVDLYFFIMVFAKENLFTEEQVAALFSIMKKTHTKAVETAFGNLEETLNYFKSLLQCHSVKRPPFCVQLFELHDVSKIMDYVTNTYFSHFKLYKYAFTPKVVLNLTIQYNNLENQDTQESVEEEITKIEENEKNEEVEVSDEIIEENSQRDENEDDVTAVNELKSIIKTAIDEEVAKLRVSINEKLKSNESQLASKINESNKSMLSTNKNEKKGKKR